MLNTTIEFNRRRFRTEMILIGRLYDWDGMTMMSMSCAVLHTRRNHETSSPHTLQF